MRRTEMPMPRHDIVITETGDGAESKNRALVRVDSSSFLSEIGPSDPDESVTLIILSCITDDQRLDAIRKRVLHAGN